MGFFRKKEKEKQNVEMTSEYKDITMMSVARQVLANPQKKLESFSSQELEVLKDPKYADTVSKINELIDIYKKLDESKKIDNILISSVSVERGMMLDSLAHECSFSLYETTTLEDFKILYDELIKNEVDKAYNELMCMRVLIDNDIEKYDNYYSRLKLNYDKDKTRVLSPISQKVIKKIDSTFISMCQNSINICFQQAKLHVDIINKQRKSNDLTSMIDDNDNYQNSNTIENKIK